MDCSIFVIQPVLGAVPPSALLSSDLRKLTVAVSLLTSAFFAFLAGLLLAQLPVAGALAYGPILWLHCYAAGYVSYSPTAFGYRRTLEAQSAHVTSCTVCEGSDDDGVCRRYGEQLVVAGIPLTTTEDGENWYCASCHAVEHGGGGSTAAGERVAESERN
ncbi:hypothetical protein [Halogeometricum borinquense]|uniref:hypothetical protein n=1 Tax=Halogeometricum borinquense TaxID=60847 RepID=UPI00343E1BA6